ncbi:MAG: polysaccharide biosynthesis C-terminal domain-containing protein [Vicinamibacterales bacterium]
MSRTVRATQWTAAGFGVQFVGQVARVVLLAHVLSPADLGRFLVLRSVVGVAGLAAQGGLGPVGLRRIAGAAGDAAARHGVVASVLPLAAAGAVVAAVLTAGGVVAAGFAPVEAGAAGILVVAAALSPVLADLARGLDLTRAAVAIERGLATLLEVVVLAVVLFRLRGSGDPFASFREVLVVIAIVAVVPVLLLAWRVARAAPPVANATPVASGPAAPASVAEARESRVPARTLVAESWPVTVNGLLWRGLGEVDLWLVGGLAGAPAAGVYGIAMRLAAALQGPVAIGAYALAPPIARHHAAGRRDALESLLRRAARWMTLGSVAGYAAVAAIGADGLARIFGADYGRAWPLFLVLGLGQVVNAICGLGGTTLLMIGRPRALMGISLACSAITIGGGWLLIPHLGPMGAALATAAGVVVQNALMVGAVRRYAGVRVHA